MIPERYREMARRTVALPAAFLRDPLSMSVIKAMTRSDTALSSRILRHAFDPNFIRIVHGIVLKKPSYRRATDVFGAGYLVNINDHISWYIFSRGYFDLAPIALGAFFAECFPGATSIDVGANIGTTSIPLAKIGIKTLGVEACAAVVGELATNVSLNSPIPYTIAHVAASSPDHVATGEMVKIFAPLQNAGAWSINENWAGATDGNRKVELTRTVTLDSLIAALNINDISLIKLDIEGAESLALQGLQNCLATKRPPVTFEWRPDIAAESGVEQDDLRTLFPQGYKFFAVQAKLTDRATARLTLQLVPFDVSKSYENVLAIDEGRACANTQLTEFLRTESATVKVSAPL